MTLPRAQRAADALTERGLDDLGLPGSYPLEADGGTVPRETCQRIGLDVKERGLRGVVCRSAASQDGRGTELAWFPATSRSRAKPVWETPRPFGMWRDAVRWIELELDDQPELR